ncbi:hypothetical protein [Cupriavidus sp. D39]|uniref:hypothetical protein n=1 Tax=Cupriavidus sp. D39 TaxID=2997877 RepID=UPI00226F41D1|nr:hypothetical protein [Cupriavidus sp. D39]MCY0855224.1 hypothetical protein [Cupriavidus sp. D39]
MRIINVATFTKRFVSIVALAAAAGGVQAVSAADLASGHGYGPGAAAARIGERDPFTDGARIDKRDVYTDGARNVDGSARFAASLDRIGVWAPPARSAVAAATLARISNRDGYTEGEHAADPRLVG